MVVVRHLLRFFEISGLRHIGDRLFDDLIAGIRVTLHDFEFFIGKPSGARFIQDRIRYIDLSDIVKRRRLRDIRDILVCQDIRELALLTEFV